MSAILLPLLSVFLTVVIEIALCAILLSQRDDFATRTFLIRSGIALTILLVLTAVTVTLLRRFTVYDDGALPAYAFALTAAIVTPALILPRSVLSARTGKFVRRCAVLGLALLAVECIVFNIGCYTKTPTQHEITLAEATSLNNKTVAVTESGIVLTGNGQFTLPVVTTDVGALRLFFDGTDTHIHATVSMKDGNRSNTFITVASSPVSATEDHIDFGISSYGELQTLRVEIGDLKETVTVTRAVYFGTLPFHYSALRFLSLMAAGILLALILTYRLYATAYNRNSRAHRAVLLLLLVACLTGVLCMDKPDDEMIPYTADLKISSQDPYVQMFDAIQKGRVSLDITPSEGLLGMENPYDRDARTAQGVSFCWDRAFYNGNYYSYYGIAPVFTFYYPVYLLTGNLPTMNQACVFFGLLAVVALFGCVLSLTKRFIRRPNFLLLLAGLAAACYATGIYMTVDFSNMYTLPGISSSAFLFLCLWCGFAGANRESGTRQNILFALSGLTLALCVASRPTKAVAALVLMPAFIAILLDKRKSCGQRVRAAASFILPLAVGASLIMAYNAARFGSPFEFGAAYQLTVSDVRANALRPELFPYAILHYFFQPLGLSPMFPFVGFTVVQLNHYGQYIYSDFSAGALTVPLIMAGVVLLPFMLRRIRRRLGADRHVMIATLLMMLILALTVAWIDFCMAGVILTYTFDILPLLTILSLLVCFGVSDGDESANGDVCQRTHTVSAVLTVICILTVLLLALEILSRTDLALFSRFPSLLQWAAEAFRVR